MANSTKKLEALRLKQVAEREALIKKLVEEDIKRFEKEGVDPNWFSDFPEWYRKYKLAEN